MAGLFKVSTRLLTFLLLVSIAYLAWGVIDRTNLFLEYVQNHDELVKNKVFDYETTSDAEIKEFKQWAVDRRPGIFDYVVTVFLSESVLMGLGATVVCWAMRAYCRTKWSAADRSIVGPDRQIVGQCCSVCEVRISDETTAQWDPSRKAPIHKLCAR